MPLVLSSDAYLLIRDKKRCFFAYYQNLHVMARSPTSVSADSIDYVTWCKAPGNSFNLTGLPSSADHRRGYERVAYVNNDHPAHFGDTFLVIIDINMARSLLFPSTEDTAILRHLPKKRP